MSAGHRAAFSLGCLLLLHTVLACAGCDQRHWVCEPADEHASSALPSRLSETGLYADSEREILNDGVLPYRPTFELWSDGANKRRWFMLPTGARIDSSDMDSWRFPEGTKIWKEFVRDGVRVETRLLTKTGPREQDWVALSYLWNADQADAHAAPEGAINALGTDHNVPAMGECTACHGGTRSRVLGISAVQLAHASDGVHANLDAFVSMDLLSHPPEQTFSVPGDEVARAALGYLHANCAHCHNQDRPAHGRPRCYEPANGLDFRLLVGALASVDDTPTYRTMGPVIKRGRPGASPLMRAVSTRDFFERMPPLAAERRDDEAVALLRAWIAGL